ncbi:hypothetical protein [Parafrankia sp. BMG5.11]|uniref:hypothetical protein n=1 Tax=Parafrankia sp. BMG5.11 TaxID=222540 RepID=UPI00103CE323|nr:hypothetical protein [Parafrankia sp. BMG5.11]TCJ40103.1 hypothetical protein E0504_06595 [Parafrankia sp. BMG5.11]
MTIQSVLGQKFAEWDECLNGSDPENLDTNSVSHVLYALYFDLCAYEAYAAVRRRSAPDNPLAAPMFDYLVGSGYVQKQVVRIRRLCEALPAIRPDGRDNSIYSLRRIVDDMRRLRSERVLTSDNIYAVYAAQAHGGEISRTALDRLCDAQGLLHKRITDELSKKVLPDRSTELRAIYDYSNKMVVHSSSQSSRQALGRDLGLTLAQVNKVIGDLTEAFYLCHRFVCLADHSPMVALGWELSFQDLGDGDLEIVREVYSRIEQQSEEHKAQAYQVLGLW